MLAGIEGGGKEGKFLLLSPACSPCQERLAASVPSEHLMPASAAASCAGGHRLSPAPSQTASQSQGRSTSLRMAFSGTFSIRLAASGFHRSSWALYLSPQAAGAPQAPPLLRSVEFSLLTRLQSPGTANNFLC